MARLSAQVFENRDKRGEDRLATNETARALIESNLALSVTVLDISASGARISVNDGSTKFPQNAKIYIAERDLIADCRVVWKNGNEIGLKFESTALL